MKFKHSNLVIFLTLLVASNCNGQIQLEMQAKLIERAEELSIELLGRRIDLPSKWAALQEREVQHLTNLELLESGLTQTTEFCAHRKLGNVTVQRLTENSHYDRGTDRTSSFEMVKRIYKKPGLCLYKANEKKWQIVPSVPFDGYPCTDPFNWCLAAYAGTKTGSLDEGSIERIFAKKVCLSAKEIKAGLQTIWGNPKLQKKPSSAVSIVFVKHKNLPISVSFDFYPSGWDPKNFAKLKHHTHCKSVVTWLEFKEIEAFLPVKIEMIETGALKKEHLEVVNRIRWLFNDQVPDALFGDPMTHEIVEPTFPDYPKEEKR